MCELVDDESVVYVCMCIYIYIICAHICTSMYVYICTYILGRYDCQYKHYLPITKHMLTTFLARVLSLQMITYALISLVTQLPRLLLY